MNEIAYFDNAATTFPKPEVVYDFADSFYRTSGGNAGRGNNIVAAASKGVALAAKDNLKKLYACPAHEVVFTSSATEALNRVLFGLDYGDGDVVMVTPFEHNAVTRPLAHLVETKGVRIELLTFDDGTLLPDYEAIENQFKLLHPRVVVMTHASNVCGAVIPVDSIAEIAARYGATTVVDMSQTCGLLSLNLVSSGIDFAIFAGHKTLYAPFGIGGFFCRRGTILNPVLFGGNGVNSVEQSMPKDIVAMSEVGSQNTYAIAGLKASTDWLLEQGFEQILERESESRDTLLELLRQYENIHIVRDNMQCERIGVVSAVFDGYSPDEVEMILSNTGIAVRSGLHCAPYAHRFLGTLPAGTVRFSISALTGENDLTHLSDSLQMIADEG